MLWGEILGGITGGLVYSMIVLPIEFSVEYSSSKQVAYFMGIIVGGLSGVIVSSEWLDVENAWSTSLVVNICFIAGLLFCMLYPCYSQLTYTMSVIYKEGAIVKQLIIKDFIVQWKYLIWHLIYPLFMYMTLIDMKSFYIIMSAIIPVIAILRTFNDDKNIIVK